jgi:hypothetical protein
MGEHRAPNPGADFEPFQRWQLTQDSAAVGTPCAACGIKFEVGDWCTPVPLGPGNDEEEMAKCAAGQPYNAVSIAVHWSCATGRGFPAGTKVNREDRRRGIAAWGGEVEN